MVALPGWHLHLDGPPRSLHVVGVISFTINKFFAVVNSNVPVPPTHILYPIVGCPTVRKDGRIWLDEPRYIETHGFVSFDKSVF